MSARSLPPLEFLVEPDVLDGVVSERMEFSSQTEQHSDRVPGWSSYRCETRISGRVSRAKPYSQPNGVSELLIDAAMQRFAEEDRLYATLGLVALASAAEPRIAKIRSGYGR